MKQTKSRKPTNKNAIVTHIEDYKLFHPKPKRPIQCSFLHPAFELNEKKKQENTNK